MSNGPCILCETPAKISLPLSDVDDEMADESLHEVELDDESVVSGWSSRAGASGAGKARNISSPDS